MHATETASLDYDFHPEAEAEYLEAIHRYDEVSIELGNRFVAEVETGIARVLQNQLWFKQVARRVRRCLLQTFPYGLLFEEEENRVFIVAVMHLHRHPDYWKKRMTGGEKHS